MRLFESVGHMKAFYIEQEIRVATYDIDFAGHVSNISYLRWLEDMRRSMFDQYCPFHEFLEKGLTPVLVSTEIKYRKGVRLFDKPKCSMWISGITKTSLTVNACITVDGELRTEVEHVGVFVNLTTLRPVRLPKEFADAVHASASSTSRI